MCKRVVFSLLGSLLALHVGAQGFSDITSQALVNPSFELMSEDEVYANPIAKTVTEVYGWTIPTPQEQSIADATSTEVGFTNNEGGVVPSDGNFFFWNRKGWGSASGELSTTTNTLDTGKYYVVFDYKAADYSNNNNHTQSGTTMQLVVSDEEGNALVTTTQAKRSYSIANGSSNPGSDTYLKDSPWVPMGAMFVMPSSGKAVITVKQNLKNNGRSDICYDNFRLYRVNDTDAGEEEFPLDITGTLANPSFEAGGNGGEWQQYSYNGWTVAKTGGEIKATAGESYVGVFGEQLHGLRVFNAWDNSSTTSKKLCQEVAGLPLGKYRLSATVTGYEGESFKLYAGDYSESITVESGDQVQSASVDFSVYDTDAIELGINSKVFFKADNFRLEYLGYDETDVPDEPGEVKTYVTLTAPGDFFIESNIPFTSTGSVDICDENAAVVFEVLRPSAVINNWLPFVRIYGEEAVNGVNCQVRMYNNGAIILPYGDEYPPLTVYSRPDFDGSSRSNFGLENTGGYMNTMTDEQMNNHVMSFRLKRGYMVTFSLQPEGRGYSRCFIADKADLEMNLPELMANRVSSYRIFKWNSTSKKGFASTTDKSLVNKVNAVWCYGWGVGYDMGPDIECVPNHLYEDWPTSSACGSATWSPHMKTNNEPKNTADDHPQDLNTILNNWQNLMRTGMRLCSPSSWDGSPNFTKEFLDAIDARGWRCDIVDLHCYWAEDKYYTLSSLYNQYKRPLWLSEFLWGASWNGDGVFSSKSYQENRTVMGRILDRLNSWGYVERYAYWNQEAWYSRLVNTDDGWVEPLGQYYRDMDTGTGYNSNYEFIPATPPMSDPTNLKGSFSEETGKVTLTWHDANGELNQRMGIERLSGDSWTDVYVVEELAEGAADYTCEVDGQVGDQFRAYVIDVNGTRRYTQAFSVPFTVSKEGQPGMTMTIQGTTYYLGGNRLTNGDFNYGLAEWQNGTGATATWPDFKANEVAGVDNGAYLQAYNHKGRDDAGSLRRKLSVDGNSFYYFSVYSKNNAGGYQIASLSDDGSSEAEVVNNLSATTDWTIDGTVFNSQAHPYFLISYRWLGSKAQFDRFYLGRLYTSKEEALADAVAQVKDEIALFCTWNTKHPALNEELQTIAGSVTGNGESDLQTLQQALATAHAGMKDAAAVDSLLQVAETLATYRLNGLSALQTAVTEAQDAGTASAYAEQHSKLQAAVDAYLPMQDHTSLILSPTFDGDATGWTRSGTYTGGDQRQDEWAGRSCWNAWWNVSTSSAGDQTLAVSQTLTGLPAGFYSLSADAATQHYCLSDQHAFLNDQQSPVLTYDRADIPDVAAADVWQTLRTQPVYLAEGEEATIGFTSSKTGALSGAYGADDREGRWFATGFRLYYTPAWQLIAEPEVLTTVCLPFSAQLPEGMLLYELLGRTADNQQVVLGESTTLEAGRPYIFASDADLLTFLHDGTLVDEPLVGSGSLTGCFFAPSELPDNDAYVLVEGTWYKVSALEEKGHADFRLANYSAYIADFEQLPEVDAEEHLTMPVVRDGEDNPDDPDDPDNPDDPDDPEDPSGIDQMQTEAADEAIIYDLQGRRVSRHQLSRGIYIWNGRKIVIK